MYCGQCGKKVMDNMLFCPFCGSPIVIPDQDAPPQQRAAENVEPDRPQVGAHVDRPAAQPDGPVSLYDSQVSPVPGGAATAGEKLRQPAQDKERAEALDAAQDKEQAEAQDEEEFVPLRFSFDDPFELDEPADAKANCDQREASAQREGYAQKPPFDDDYREAFDPDAAPDPLKLAEATDAVEAEPGQIMDIPEEVAPPIRSAEPARRQDMPRPENLRRRATNTYIPVKQVNINDIFMDGDDDDYDLDEDVDDYDLDDYDLDDVLDEDFDDEDYDFEEREEGSFMRRHVRGMVGLILFLLLAAICVFWASTDRGQLTLARFNLAWRAEPYAELGYEAYLADSDLMAARYYEKALSRNNQNYEYAHSAMVAYYEADDVEAAANMLRRCIAMQPDNAEPYREMLILYPDPENRPWEISELIRTGYQRTGDEALKGQ